MDCDMSRSYENLLALDLDCFSNGSWSDDEEGIDLTSQLIPTTPKPVYLPSCSMEAHPRFRELKAWDDPPIYIPPRSIDARPRFRELYTSSAYISPRSIEAQPRFGQLKNNYDEECLKLADEPIEVCENNTISSRPVSSFLSMVLFVYGAEASTDDYFHKIIQPPELGRQEIDVRGYENSYLTGFDLTEDTLELVQREDLEGTPPSIVNGRVYILTEPAHLVQFNQHLKDFNLGTLIRTDKIVTCAMLQVGTEGGYTTLATRKSGYTYGKFPTAYCTQVETSISAIPDSAIDPRLLEISHTNEVPMPDDMQYATEFSLLEDPDFVYESNGQLFHVPNMTDEPVDMWMGFGDAQ